MESSKIDPIERKEDIGDNGNQEGQRPNFAKPFIKGRPMNLFSMGQRKGHAYGKEKKKNNQAWQCVPKGGTHDINGNKSKIV